MQDEALALLPAMAEARDRFMELVDELRPELHRYCARMTGSVFDGEDVVQDTLAKAYYALGQMREPPSLKPWLFRIAHNAAMDFLRRYERRNVDVVPDLPDRAELEEVGVDPELVEAALTVFVELPPVQRGAIILKDVLGHSLEEVAVTMETSVGAVKSALFRVRANARHKSPRSHKRGKTAMKTPPIVSAQEWEAAREQLLVKEKALMRARDALAAERRRMPWVAVEKTYEFDGPNGKVSLLDLFEGRRQLIVYRAFLEPGVFGWPEHACRGCSLGADQVTHLAHLNARDTTLAYVSRAPQPDIARVKARMGWEMPWYTITDSFDADFGVDEWHGHNVFFRDGERVFRTYFINSRGDEAMGTTWSYLDATPLGRQEEWEVSPEGYPQSPPYEWWNWHDEYGAAGATPDPKWVEILGSAQATSQEPQPTGEVNL